jgi:glycolate oxidase
MFLLGDTKLNEDVVVPLDAYEKLIDWTLKIKADTGLSTPTFGHLGDGNFHVHVMFDHLEAGAPERAAGAVESLMQGVVSMGGCITGEHGIGLAKSPFLGLQHSAEEIEAMRRVKAALDPHNILNPDKQFTPVELWRLPRMRDYHFPWDHKH